MNKSLLATSFACMLFASASVQGATKGPTIYSKAHVAMNNIDNSNSNSEFDVKSGSSRLGMKRNIPIAGKFKGIYKIEIQIDLSDDSNGDYCIVSKL